MNAQGRLVTAEELFELATPLEAGKIELLEGRVVRYGPSGGQHGAITADVGSALLCFVKDHGLGAVGASIGYILQRDPDSVRGPDIRFVARARLPGGELPRTFVEGAPRPCCRGRLARGQRQ